MSIAAKIFTIPDKFSFDEDTSLKVFLREGTDSNIEISVRNMRKVDSLLLQFFIAASRKWRSLGLDFAITDVSSDFDSALKLLGLSEETLSWKVSA